MIPVYVVSDTPTYGASNRPAAISRTRMEAAATNVRVAARAGDNGRSDRSASGSLRPRRSVTRRGYAGLGGRSLSISGGGPSPYPSRVTTNARIEAIERATGRSWDDWLSWMASIDADRLSHHEIATALLTELDGKVDNVGWWAQATAVAYEHDVGRRVPGQRPDGTFQTSVSRSTSLGMEALIQAWTDFAAADQDVLDRITGAARVSGTANRITWRAKGRDVSAYTVISEPKKDGTASLVVQIIGTASLDDNVEAKETWTAITARFVATLA